MNTNVSVPSVFTMARGTAATAAAMAAAAASANAAEAADRSADPAAVTVLLSHASSPPPQAAALKMPQAVPFSPRPKLLPSFCGRHAMRTLGRRGKGEGIGGWSRLPKLVGPRVVAADNRVGLGG